jgi:SAM-dependent methyltransferase
MDDFERKWRSRFERFALGHSEDHLVSGWSRQGLLRRVAAVSRLIDEQFGETRLRILDLGCGAGTYVRFFAELGHRVVGFDYSRPSLRRAQAGDPGRRGQYVEGEAYGLPFRTGSFDAAIAVGIFQALGNAETAIDEILRVLRPGGSVIIETLNAAEPSALVRSAIARFRGSADPVRVYSPFRVKGWLSRRGAPPLRQVGIYLPPRRLSWLGPVFDPRALPAVLERLPGAPLLSAHAFLTLARKRP